MIPRIHLKPERASPTVQTGFPTLSRAGSSQQFALLSLLSVREREPGFSIPQHVEELVPTWIFPLLPRQTVHMMSCGLGTNREEPEIDRKRNRK